MSTANKIRACVWTIVALAILQGTVLLAATPRVDGNGALVEQLRADIELIYSVSGIIITALSVAVGVLWRALRMSQKEFVETLKRLAANNNAKE